MLNLHLNKTTNPIVAHGHGLLTNEIFTHQLPSYPTAKDESIANKQPSIDQYLLQDHLSNDEQVT